MANSDKEILITPNKNQASLPEIKFTGANNTPVYLRVLDDGTVSIEGTNGQLFSVTDSMTGTIFSVNDVSGIPSIEVLDNGTIRLGAYGGSVVAPSFSGNVEFSGLITDYSANEGSQYIPPDQFFYRGANAAGITTTATNPYGVSPNLTAYGVYDFEYWLGLANSSTGTITLGWAATSVTRLISEVIVLPQSNTTAYAGINPFINTTNKAITGGNSAATHWIRIRGFVVNGVTTQRLPLQVSVSGGTITPQAGSWFKFTNRGVSTSGTSNITYGNTL